MAYSENDITFHCRARRVRSSSKHLLSEDEFDLASPSSQAMVCTLCHWIQNQGTPTWPGFDVDSYESALGPELLLTPLGDIMTVASPGKPRHRRCNSGASSAVCASPGSTCESSFRIPVYDISNVTTMDHNKLIFDTPASVWELQCPTSNSHDMLLAFLMTQVKTISDQRHSNQSAVKTVSSCDETACSSSHSATTQLESRDDSIEALTDRCIRLSVEKESMKDKFELGWSKAVNDITSIVSGKAV